MSKLKAQSHSSKLKTEIIKSKIKFQNAKLTLLNNFKSRDIMHYVYVLQSDKDKQFYVGYCKDLKLRFEQHQKGQVESTKNRRPLKLIYYEACVNQEDATKREKYLKTYHGKMYLKKRLKSYLTG